MSKDWIGWYYGWGWAIWVGSMFLLCSVVGNWIYTYRAHRRFGNLYRKRNAFYILNERYSAGEISQDEYDRMKSEIAGEVKLPSRKSA